MPVSSSPIRIVSSRDPSLGARVVRRVPMQYTDGEDTAIDRPAFVRAASSMAWVGNRIALVQDDVNFVALVDPATGMADAITLPAGRDDLRQFDDGRGNKKFKLDLEAMVRVPLRDGTLLLGFGSGSKKRRESVMTLKFSGRGVRPKAEEPVLVPLPELYDALRALTDFSGSDMNIEGAVYLDGVIRLFGRSNGEAKNDLVPVDATCDIAWKALHLHLANPDGDTLPAVSRVTQFELGDMDGVKLGFTDAIPLRRATVLYSAAAEASKDAASDGAVVGSALGVIPNDQRKPARWAPITDERGGVFTGKVEGVALDARDPMRVLAVIDVDDFTRPSELCELELTGPWPTR